MHVFDATKCSMQTQIVKISWNMVKRHINLLWPWPRWPVWCNKPTWSATLGELNPLAMPMAPDTLTHWVVINKDQHGFEKNEIKNANGAWHINTPAKQNILIPTTQSIPYYICKADLSFGIGQQCSLCVCQSFVKCDIDRSCQDSQWLHSISNQDWWWAGTQHLWQLLCFSGVPGVRSMGPDCHSVTPSKTICRLTWWGWWG